MRFITEPRQNKKIEKNFLRRALKTMQMETFDLPQDVCIEKIYTLKEHFAKAPKSDIPESIEEGMFLCDMANAYLHLLAGATGWKFGYLVAKEKWDDDYAAVVSPSHAYSVSPFVQIPLEYKIKNNSMVDLYEKIKSGKLPPSEPGNFLDLAAHFYYHSENAYFFPLQEDKARGVTRLVEKSAPLIGAIFAKDGNLLNVSQELAIQNIEKNILQDRSDFAKTPEPIYLAALGALYGHLIALGCGYAWGTSYYEQCNGGIVLHSPDQRYYINPSKIIKGELKSKNTTCRLLSLYTQIKNNQLPPLESEGYPDEIL
jgi:hypothetical protein